MNETETSNEQEMSDYVRALGEKSKENRDVYKTQYYWAIGLLLLGVGAVLFLPYLVAYLDNHFIPSTEITTIKQNIYANKSDLSDLRKSVSPLSISRIDIVGYDVGWIKKSKRDSLIVELNGKGVVELTFDEMEESNSVEIKEQQFIFDPGGDNVIIRSGSYNAGPIMEVLVQDPKDDEDDNKYTIYSRRNRDENWTNQKIETPKSNNSNSMHVAFSRSDVFLFHSSGYIYRSSDLRESWVRIKMGFGKNAQIQSLLVDEKCRLVLLRKDGDLSYSKDCGDNWAVIKSQTDKIKYFESGLIIPSGMVILVRSDGYLVEFNMITGRFNYGIDVGVRYKDIADMYFSGEDIILLLNGDSYPVISVDNGHTWKPVTLDLESRKSMSLRRVEFYDDGSAFAFNSQGEVSLVSNDSGRSWGFATGIPSIKRVASSVSADDYRVIFGKESDAIIKRPQSRGWKKFRYI